MTEFKEFERLKDLFIPYDHKKSKKFIEGLEKDAITWFKSMGAVFGRKSQYLAAEAEFNWYYAGGVLFFGVKSLSDSEYAYQHVLLALHYQHWEKQSFYDGWDFGRGVSEKRIEQKGNGQDNPYSKNDIIDHHSWNAGWTWGLYNKKPLNK